MLTRLLFTLAILLAIVAVGLGQITIPNSFSTGTTISSTAVNANFTELGDKALNRTGGNLTGNVTADANVTIDGVDISDYLSGGNVTATQTVLNGVTYSWPGADGSTGQILQTNGSATLSWATSVPAGAVMFFNLSSCPSGWSEYTSARGRVVAGLPASGTLQGTVGSALTDQGTRTITSVVAHTHSVDPPSTESSSSGSHTHTVATTDTSSVGGSGPLLQNNEPSNGTDTSSSSGAHTHTTDIGAFNSASTGDASVDVTMPYIQLLACQKS